MATINIDRLLVAPLLGWALFVAGPCAQAQQFNSDNYWTAPHGTETTIATIGQHYSALVGVVTLFPTWEFNLGATLYKEDQTTNTTDHYSTTFYVKHMMYENEAKNGGWAIVGGTGLQPGYLKSGTISGDFRTYWVNVPITIAFLDGALSWDILPGVSLNKEYDVQKEKAWGYTYSTRLAAYKIIPQSAIVGEIFGTEGDAYSKPQYRAGVRWESKSVIAALTYGAALDGTRGAGLEFGIMILSPQFLCIGGCK